MLCATVLRPKANDDEAAECEVMDAEEGAAVLTEIHDDDETRSPGRKRKKFVDGMSDDTLSRRFSVLDNAVETERGM